MSSFSYLLCIVLWFGTTTGGNTEAKERQKHKTNITGAENTKVSTLQNTCDHG